ncbi:MAG: polysaccharide biosynthesis protein [Myxococcaceae bacterium]|nr:polysaccharide biosynthesis protein [Myxococcaceae bacterium]
MPVDTLGQRLLLHYRRALQVFLHLVLWSVALGGAFLLRFEFSLPDEYFPNLYRWVAVLLLIRSVSFAGFGMFSGMWRYTGAKDVVALFKATTVSSGLFLAYIWLAGVRGFPRSILFIEWMLTMVSVGGMRFGVRTLWQLAASVARDEKQQERRRLLIVGAGDAGEHLLREMQRVYSARYTPVAFADDDSRKLGQSIHGIPVLGPLARVPEIARSKRVDEIIIAIPSATGRDMRRIIELCKPSGASIRTMPGIDQLIDGKITVNQLRQVDIEDLLGREAVTLDQRAIVDAVQGRVVMVTGAGGSIGSELCRQLCRFKPSQLLLVERSENALFEVHRELHAKHPGLQLVACIADITDKRRMEQLFERHRPSMVLHAAAHKHVPMMELNPAEAIKNNVQGTRLLADVASANGVERFVMISTDKAVNPTSVMGASKRLAEIYIQAMSQRSRTLFTAVRFGNVLGSAGSVLPIFKEQIAAGGPVTVTHPEMRRYFMTIPEASQLVLQAGTMGRGGEIFVLDMGEPVKIVDLARDLITLSGLTPDKDIEIRFSGVRPGEKLFEELSTKDEAADKTLHPKIFIGRLTPKPYDGVITSLDSLAALAEQGALGPAIVEKMRELVPELQREAVNDDPAAREEATADVIPLRRPA